MYFWFEQIPAILSDMYMYMSLVIYMYMYI